MRRRLLENLVMRENYRTTLRASVLVAISGILYGFLGYLGTNVIRDEMSISSMLFWRFFIAAIWIFFFVVYKHAKQTTANYPNKSTLLKIFILGAVAYAGCSGFYFLSSKYIGTGLAMVIFFCYPIMVALISWLLHGYKLNLGIILTLVSISIGLYLIHNSSSDELSLLGIGFGIINAFCYALYLLASKQLSNLSIDSNIYTIMVCFGSFFIFLIMALANHTFVFPSNLKTVGYILALGILATAIPIQLMLEGLKYVSSLRASIISVLEPLITMVVGFILLNESISNLQIIGAVIILGSTLLVQFNRDI
ncbi:MAG: DMT family transporter [Pseudomonadota bacterium]